MAMMACSTSSDFGCQKQDILVKLTFDCCHLKDTLIRKLPKNVTVNDLMEEHPDYDSKSYTVSCVSNQPHGDTVTPDGTCSIGEIKDSFGISSYIIKCTRTENKGKQSADFTPGASGSVVEGVARLNAFTMMMARPRVQ